MNRYHIMKFFVDRRCFPKKYYRLRVGHQIKFGGSSRFVVMTGPEDDQEEETEETAAELMEKANRKAAEKKIQVSKIRLKQAEDIIKSRP